MNTWIDLHAVLQILVVGLLVGAGLPAVFAVGLRALGAGDGNATRSSDDDRIVGGSVIGIITAMVCFAVVLTAVGLGIYSIVASS